MILARMVVAIGLMTFVGLVPGCSVPRDGGGDDLDPITGAIIANHTSIDLTAIPDTWIGQAKQRLHIAYGTASHGLQIYYGAVGLNAWDGTSKYAFNNGGTGGALDFRVWPTPGYFGDLNMALSLELAANTSGNRTVWADATRVYLYAHPEVNVIMWAWCYGADSSSANIDLYLSLMAGLEREYPNVKFVYMTGHTNGTGETGNLHIRNNQIRAYCAANNKILYDFEDIESWNPDGVYFGDRNCNANCDYTGGNWAIEWQNAHPGEWFPCDQCYGCHSQPLNCNLKARAVWWLFARLAGWDGN
jgi:hypothetical protein